MAGEPESLNVDEGLKRHERRHWFDRLIMLSDGVFAIAITLLAFDLHVPETWTGVADLWNGLAPQLDAFALSFLVISIYWLSHRRFMAMILTVDAPVTVLNLVMLALISLLPAATKLAHAQGPLQPAMLVYGALVVAIGLTQAVLWGYAALIANLVSPEVPMGVRAYLLVLMIFTPPFFLVLVMAIPYAGFGAVPMSLAALFLIGWRMRMGVLWWLARGKKAQPAEE
jgi:uncharacterized membrane protein